MDANKLKVLREIEYTISPACGRCRFMNDNDKLWSTCKLFKYEHEKHTGEPRQLSVYRHGSCAKFEPIDMDLLHGFQEFVKWLKRLKKNC